MKFLLDENQSPRIADHLAAEGHDTVQVRDLDMRTSPDEDVLAAALHPGSRNTVLTQELVERPWVR